MTTTYTATLTTSAHADVVESMLDDLPGSAMVGYPHDKTVDVVFALEAETPALALLAASGSIARHSRVLGDSEVVLAITAD